MERARGLATLLGARGAKTFLSTAWPESPFVVHLPPKRLAGLERLPELATLRSLAAMQCGSMLVQSQTQSDDYFSLPVNPAQAIALYQAGMTLYLVDVRSSSPELGRWVEALEQDLGLPPVTRPGVLISRVGKGVRMHFDSQEGFIIQLRGRKVWRIAPNRHVSHPPINYVTGTPLPATLSKLCPQGLPQKMPDDAVSIELRPGSVLFLPRGHWHQTETTQDSLHLDLMMPIPTWAQLMLGSLGRRLEGQARWRAPAVGAWGTDRRSASKALSQMLIRLREDLAQLNLDDL